MKKSSRQKDSKMIKVEKLCYTYSDDTQALININVTFPQEHIFAIMGLSGSGKTTLLNCLARFLKPQQGIISLNDKNIQDMTEHDFRSAVGVVFQHLNLFPHLTVLENMTLAPCRTQKRARDEAKKSALEMLDRLGIPELAENYPSQVSGGQAQRVAIARGLMLKPDIMLLDEPTSALDPKTTMEFAQWLRELQCDTSFIIVTHDLPFAENVAARGMYMSDGEVKEFGLINDILTHVRKV